MGKEVSAEKSEGAEKSESAEKAESAEKLSAKKESPKVGAKKESPKNPKKDLTDPGAFEAALALLARWVEHRGLQASAPLVALRALRGRQRLPGPFPYYRAGIARLRCSAALLAASSSMIRAFRASKGINQRFGSIRPSQKRNTNPRGNKKTPVLGRCRCLSTHF